MEKISPTQFIAQCMPVTQFSDEEQCDAQCAFSGRNIRRGVALKKLLSGNFTDHAFIRYQSSYAGLDVTACIRPFAGDSRASLRNYSFYCDGSHLRLLKREEIWPLLVSEKHGDFILAVTYNAKKHISYKTQIQSSPENYTVFTDAGEVFVNHTHLITVAKIVQRWYTVVQGKADSAAQPTWFTKDEIYTGVFPMAKIMAYGYERFFDEKKQVEHLHNMPLMRLITHTINKAL